MEDFHPQIRYDRNAEPQDKELIEKFVALASGLPEQFVERCMLVAERGRSSVVPNTSDIQPSGEIENGIISLWHQISQNGGDLFRSTVERFDRETEEAFRADLRVRDLATELSAINSSMRATSIPPGENRPIETKAAKLHKQSLRNTLEKDILRTKFIIYLGRTSLGHQVEKVNDYIEISKKRDMGEPA